MESSGEEGAFSPAQSHPLRDGLVCVWADVSSAGALQTWLHGAPDDPERIVYDNYVIYLYPFSQDGLVNADIDQTGETRWAALLNRDIPLPTLERKISQ